MTLCSTVGPYRCALPAQRFPLHCCDIKTRCASELVPAPVPEPVPQGFASRRARCLCLPQDWTNRFIAMRDAVGYGSPGYLLHETAIWNPFLNKWHFLPRRASKTEYSEAADEKMGTNLLISTGPAFDSFDYITVGVSFARRTRPSPGYAFWLRPSASRWLMCSVNVFTDRGCLLDTPSDVALCSCVRLPLRRPSLRNAGSPPPSWSLDPRAGSSLPSRARRAAWLAGKRCKLRSFPFSLLTARCCWRRRRSLVEQSLRELSSPLECLPGQPGRVATRMSLSLSGCRLHTAYGIEPALLAALFSHSLGHDSSQFLCCLVSGWQPSHEFTHTPHGARARDGSEERPGSPRGLEHRVRSLLEVTVTLAMTE